MESLLLRETRASGRRISFDITANKAALCIFHLVIDNKRALVYNPLFFYSFVKSMIFLLFNASDDCKN